MAKVKSEKIKPARAGKQSSSLVTEEAIARRAYEIYLQRAGENGRDLDDWLEAERSLRSEPEPSVKRDTNAHLGRRGAE